MALWIAESGALSTLQDAGRAGYERFGVPVSGAMDWYALQAANRLVGNPDGAAAIEFAFQGPAMVTEGDYLAAICGGGFYPVVDGRTLPGWTAIYLRAGQTLAVGSREPGCWGYVAIGGGLDAPDVLGSASTYLRGGFGGLDGRALRAGDWLYPREAGRVRVELAGRRLDPQAQPVAAQEVIVRVVPGPQSDWFDPHGLEVFTGSTYRVGANSDRMGYRLEGEMIPRRKGDLLSEGMVFGAVQVPPDGKPIVMMADRPATGGYPKIATVIRADVPRLAQLRPGEGRANFQVVTVAQAQMAYRELVSKMIIEKESDELWMTG
jgi:antagonist of KipI